MEDKLNRDQRIRLESLAQAGQLLGRIEVDHHGNAPTPAVIQIAEALEAYVRGDSPGKAYRPSAGALAAREALDWTLARLAEPELATAGAEGTFHSVAHEDLEALEATLQAALEAVEEPIPLAEYPSIRTLLHAVDRILVALSETHALPAARAVEAERAHLHQAAAAIRNGSSPPEDLELEPRTSSLLEASMVILDQLPVALPPCFDGREVARLREAVRAFRPSYPEA